MLIKIPPASACKEHEVTDEKIYRQRRHFLSQGALLTAGLLLSACNKTESAASRNTAVSADELTPFQDVTSYNNFYEFGTDKSDPARLATGFKTKPWSLRIEGEVKQAGDYALEDLLAKHPSQERIYRLRCVEAWSMVIPWLGFPLADLIKQVEPLSSARFVQFETLNDANQMPGLKSAVLDWPYVEGLRMDEAMHPLTLLATGLYGKDLLGQNGAPLRLVVPWKYGFKSIKSIVALRFVAEQPATAWNQRAPREYGFYANVNPAVDHPRWSQKKERRLGEFQKRETRLFNGYDEVASLYGDLDLKTYF